ncbi:MAG: type II secretion system F family protein [Candidatus Micrarchaeota archaeon]
MEEKTISQVQKQFGPRKKTSRQSFAEPFLIYFPDLKKKLYLANSSETPTQFLEKVIISTVYISLAIAIFVAIGLNAMEINLFFTLLVLPFIAITLFSYLMFYPEVKIIRRQKNIECELVFAGRHILIALRAGMPLFDSIIGVSSGYGTVSEEFRKIIEKVNLGVPIGQAIRESSIDSPSNAFSRIMMQISNAISSGADVASSLEVVLNQIAKEQAIALKEYGHKLNPMVMFFMIFGIIFPSLGVAFAIILFMLVSGGTLGISSASLIYVIIFITMVQFVFLSIMESSKPRYVL